MFEAKKKLIIGAAVASFLLGGCGAGTAALASSAQAAGNAQIVRQEVGDEAEDSAEGLDVAISGDALDRASAAALDYVGQGRVTGSEVGDEESYYEIEVTLDDGSQVDVQLDESFNVVSQEADGIEAENDEDVNDEDVNEVDDDDANEIENNDAGEVEESDANEAQESEEAEDAAEGPDVSITGSALEQASAAALAYVGQGRITGTEIGDEEGYYEIEVTLDNGSQVDVHLDENFNVLSQIEDRD